MLASRYEMSDRRNRDEGHQISCLGVVIKLIELAITTSDSMLSRGVVQAKRSVHDHGDDGGIETIL